LPINESTTGAEDSIRLPAPPIWVLALCSACGVVALTVFSPILPLIKSDLGVSSSQVQQLLTSFLVALALGQLVWGVLSDRYGRRPVLLIGALLFTFSGAAVVVTDEIRLLVVLRFIQGFGAAACMAMARAMVNDAFARTQAARQMSTISMVLSVAPALSLAGSGWLAELAGWKSTCVVLVVAGVVLVFSARLYAKETHVRPIAKIDFNVVLSAYREVLRNPVFNYWTLASGMQVGIFFCLNGFLAYQFQRNGYTLSEFGLWFSLTPLFYLIGNTCNRTWFVHKGIERAALIGSCLSLCAAVSMLATQSVGLTHALSLALPCCLFGFSNGIIVANSTVGAISAAGNRRGTGTGIVGAMQMATGGIAGAIIVALGGTQTFWIAALVVICMAMISIMCMLYVYRRRPAEAA